MLRDAHSFRVRVRAALALAHVADARAPGALEAALFDASAAVRGAAAAGLAQIGSVRAVPALRRAAADPEAIVAQEAKAALRAIAAREAIHHAVARTHTAPEPTRRRVPAGSTRSLSHVRYAVVLGEMRNRSGAGGDELRGLLAERIASELHELPDVAGFPTPVMTEDIARALARRGVPLLRFEGNLTQLSVRREFGQAMLHCEVSLLLMDEPERTLRSSLRGGATGSEQVRGEPAQQAAALARKTLRNAVRSALANVEQALSAAAAQRGPSSDIRASADLERR